MLRKLIMVLLSIRCLEVKSKMLQQEKKEVQNKNADWKCPLELQHSILMFNSAGLYDNNDDDIYNDCDDDADACWSSIRHPNQ